MAGQSGREDNGFFGSYGWVVKVFASATSVVAGLVAFGFFSEAALYEMAGLPRLSADLAFLAEAGARGLVSSVGAIGFEGGLVLLLVLGIAFCSWSLRDRAAVRRLVQAPVLLVLAQVVVLAGAVVLLGSLVSVARVGTAGGRDLHTERAKIAIAQARDQEEWTPTRELEIIERLRIAPTRLAAVPMTMGRWLRTLLPPWSQQLASEQPALGFPIRPTPELRREARDFYGWLAVGAILLPAAVVLLRRWRAWISTRYLLRLRELRNWLWSRRTPDGEPAPPPDPDTRTAWGEGLQRQQRWSAYGEASRLLLEPVLIGLSLFVVALLPSAHGVLAEPSIGLQPVLVRLVSSDDEVCAPGSRSVVSPELEGETGPALPPHWNEASAAEDVLPARWSTDEPAIRRASGPCTCSAADLEALDARIAKYRGAWQSMTLSRPSELKDYSELLARYRRGVDELVGFALRLRCPEAFRRLWVLSPEPSELEAQPTVASYFLERFGEAVGRDGFGLYGHLLAAPRGEEKGHLTLFTHFGRDRWMLREIQRDQVSEIIVLPREREIAVDETVATIVSTPIPHRLDELGLFPGAYSLQRALELYESGYLPHSAQARLLTILGVLGRVGGSEQSPLREKIVNSLADAVENGLLAARESLTAEGAPSIDLAGTATTSLSIVGGPYAARRLAALVDPSANGSSPQAIATSQIEGIPTLVTSAGRLASDLRESLRLYPARRNGCSPDPFSASCHSAETLALRRLVSFLADAAGRTDLSMDIRMAACTGLGTTLWPNAQSRAFELGIGALQKAEHDLAGHCLVHTPSRISERQRAWLRATALGRHHVAERSAPAPDSALATTSAPSPPTPIPDRLRRLAVLELQEAGLWGEGKLVFELLTTVVENEFLETVGRIVNEVDPTFATGAISACLDSSQPLEQRRRCALAAGLLHQTEDGDSGLTMSVLAPLLADADEPELQRSACAASFTLAARGGRAASRLIEEHSETCLQVVAELATADGDGLLRMLVEPAETSSDQQAEAEHLPAGDLLGFAQAALESRDPSAFASAARVIVSAGDERSLDWLADVARRDPDELFALGSLAALLEADREAWAPLAAELYLTRPAGLLVQTAGKFLEDAPAGDLEPRLRACVGTTQPITARCAVGLALLATSWRASDETKSALAAASAAGSEPACRALGEIGVRGDVQALELARQDCPVIVDELSAMPAQVRWARHLLALVAVLQEEGAPLASLERLETEAANIRQFLDLVARTEPEST